MKLHTNKEQKINRNFDYLLNLERKMRKGKEKKSKKRDDNTFYFHQPILRNGKKKRCKERDNNAYYLENRTKKWEEKSDAKKETTLHII